MTELAAALTAPGAPKARVSEKSGAMMVRMRKVSLVACTGALLGCSCRHSPSPDGGALCAPQRAELPICCSELIFGAFDREAPTLLDALVSAIGAVESVEGLEVLHIEPDELVWASEIAERTGRTRQSVDMLIKGQRPCRLQLAMRLYPPVAILKALDAESFTGGDTGLLFVSPAGAQLQEGQGDVRERLPTFEVTVRSTAGRPPSGCRPARSAGEAGGPGVRGQAATRVAWAAFQACGVRVLKVSWGTVGKRLSTSRRMVQIRD